MSAPLKVGVAGAGMVSRHHLIAWSRCADAQVVAIADPDVAAARRRAEEFAIPAIHADARAMIEEGGFDALDIAAPLSAHAELVALAASAALPACCQKPLGATVVQAEAIARIAEAAGTRLMVHENWRFRPHYRTIKRWLEEERIGPVGAFHMAVEGSGLLPDATGERPALVRQPFLATMDRLIVLELLVHHLDTLRFLFGPFKVSAARIARLSDAVVGEDTVAAFLEGKVFGTLAAGWSVHDRPARASDRLVILGRDGTIRLEDGSLNVTGAHPVRLAVDGEADYQASYDATVAHFAQALRTGSPFETPPAVHASALAAAEHIYGLAAR